MHQPPSILAPPPKRRGRPKGSKDKRPRRAIARIYMDRYEAKLGELPLDYMLRVMRDPRQPQERRDMMAIKAAPYRHAAFAAVKVDYPTVSLENILAEATNEELAALERLVAALQARLSQQETVRS
jgi:hypothetical protein